MEFEFFDVATNFAFVATFALVLAAFIPLLLSVKKTWEAKDKE